MKNSVGGASSDLNSARVMLKRTRPRRGTMDPVDLLKYDLGRVYLEPEATTDIFRSATFSA